METNALDSWVPARCKHCGLTVVPEGAADEVAKGGRWDEQTNSSWVHNPLEVNSDVNHPKIRSHDAEPHDDRSIHEEFEGVSKYMEQADLAEQLNRNLSSQFDK